MADASSPDTIAAIATPPGRGGVGIVRLSGPQAGVIAARLVRLHRPLEARQARFVAVVDPTAADPEAAPPIDEAVVTAFFAPQSYTGEDVVEIAAHGSPVVLDLLLTAALRHGARLAAAGEFTQRAFLAGRLDLTQAEAVHDLIAAQTLEQARSAARQLGGALSQRIAPVKEQLLQLIALLEAGMDFASGELDDVDVVPPGQIATAISAVHRALSDLAASFRGGSLLRSGASLALVGRPNAGKSSLFNRLLERPRAIVTPLPGTTRDTVEESWALAGIPLRLVDTAGLRLAGETPADEAERLGIERSREALADADLVLLVHDATAATPHQGERELMAGLQNRPFLRVRNKIDLLRPTEPAASSDPTPPSPPMPPPPPPKPPKSPEIPKIPKIPKIPPVAYPETTPPPILSVSALTGEGLAELRAAILQGLNAAGNLLQSGALNNRRQQEDVLVAIRALEAAAAANAAALPHEILLLDLHAALEALDSLTGQTTSDDILNRIFSTFCIGK